MRKILGVFGILTALVASVFPQVVEASVVHQKFAHGTYAPRTASVTICVGVGAQYVKPPSGYVVTSVGVAGPSYNLGPCGASNTSGMSYKVWTQLKSGATVCVGMGSPSTVLPSGYVVTSVGVAGPSYNACGANNTSGINSQVWTRTSGIL